MPGLHPSDPGRPWNEYDGGAEPTEESDPDITDQIINELRHLRGAEIVGDGFKSASACLRLFHLIAERDGDEWMDASADDLVLHAMETTHPHMWRAEIEAAQQRMAA